MHRQPLSCVVVQPDRRHPHRYERAVRWAARPRLSGRCAAPSRRGAQSGLREGRLGDDRYAAGGVVAREPESRVAPRGATTRPQRRSCIRHAVAQRSPSCARVMSASVANDKAPTAFPLVRALIHRVGVTVCWFRTSRTRVSRHAGLMSREIPESTALDAEPAGHDIHSFADHRRGGRGPSCP